MLYTFGSIDKIQLGPRYEGHLNSMAEPIPYVIRPLVRTHVYHPYFAADRQAETDSFNFERCRRVCAPILNAVWSRGSAITVAPYGQLLAHKIIYFLLGRCSTDRPLAMHDVGYAEGADSRSGISAIMRPASIGYG